MILTPFNKPTNNYSAEAIAYSISGELFPTFDSIILFVSNEQKEATKLFFSENNFSNSAKIFKIHHGVSNKIAIEMAKASYKKVFDGNGHVVGMDSFKSEAKKYQSLAMAALAE